MEVEPDVGGEEESSAWDRVKFRVASWVGETAIPLVLLVCAALLLSCVFGYLLGVGVSSPSSPPCRVSCCISQWCCPHCHDCPFSQCYWQG